MVPCMQRVVLYPHYITAGKTVAEGRRIPKELGQLACMHGAHLHGSKKLFIARVAVQPLLLATCW